MNLLEAISLIGFCGMGLAVVVYMFYCVIRYPEENGKALPPANPNVAVPPGISV